jgi:hypothetical protein
LGIANRPTGYEKLTQPNRDVKKKEQGKGVSEVVSVAAAG